MRSFKTRKSTEEILNIQVESPKIKFSHAPYTVSVYEIRENENVPYNTTSHILYIYKTKHVLYKYEKEIEFLSKILQTQR